MWHCVDSAFECSSVDRVGFFSAFASYLTFDSNDVPYCARIAMYDPFSLFWATWLRPLAHRYGRTGCHPWINSSWFVDHCHGNCRPMKTTLGGLDWVWVLFIGCCYYSSQLIDLEGGLPNSETLSFYACIQQDSPAFVVPLLSILEFDHHWFIISWCLCHPLKRLAFVFVRRVTLQERPLGFFCSLFHLLSCLCPSDWLSYDWMWIYWYFILQIKT